MDFLKSIARLGLHGAGGLAVLRRLRPGLRIVTYHRFPADSLDGLEQQCRHLRRYYFPVSMAQVAESFETGRPLPPNAIAITVDDGYRDFERAAPIFRAAEISATVFLVTGFLDRKLWLWWDPLDYALRHTRSSDVRADGQMFPIATPEQRTVAFDSIVARAKSIPNSQRIQFIDDLVQQLQVVLPEQPPADYAALGWDQVRELRRHGFEFGAHSATHPILSRLSTSDELEREIVESRDRIAQELGEPVRHFCYPNGQPEDWNENTVKAVSSAGFATASTTVKGLNRRVESPYRLQRLSVDPTFSPHYFAECLAGMH
jgi:peptidoglycan/xylan/chitin deacetylase (PgdA/CDA1 family)